MANSKYSLAGIHLPQNKDLVQLGKEISFIIGVLIIVIAVMILIGWLTNITFLKSYFFPSPEIAPSIAVAFIFTSVVLLLDEKYAITQRKIGFIGLPSICAAIVCLISLARMILYVTGNGKFVSLSIDLYLLLIGVAFILPYTKVRHRYHFMNLLALFVAITSSVTILGYFYQLTFLYPHSRLVYLPVNIAIIFSFLSNAALLRWAGRGFIGMLTIDTVSGLLALRLLVVNLILTPIVGFIILIGVQRGWYNPYEGIAIFVVVQMILSSILEWFNIKFSYKLELERFLIKEELRVRNIDLKLGEEDMETRVKELAAAKEQYAEKLSYQDKFKDTAEALG